MTVAVTAKRRRRQAVNRFKHMALIGRGNNNRSVYARHTAETLKKRQDALIEKQKMMAARRSRKKR